MPSSFTQVRIGRRHDTYAQPYFPGTIDEARIYNRALSATEILALYKKGATQIGGNEKLKITDGLVGYWPFNGTDMNWTSGTAGTAYDRSGRGNDGTLTNMNEQTSVTLGKLGQALKFTVSDGSYVSIPQASDSNYTGAITLSAWVHLDAGDEYHHIISKGAGS